MVPRNSTPAVSSVRELASELRVTDSSYRQDSGIMVDFAVHCNNRRCLGNQRLDVSEKHSRKKKKKNSRSASNSSGVPPSHGGEQGLVLAQNGPSLGY